MVHFWIQGIIGLFGENTPFENSGSEKNKKQMQHLCINCYTEGECEIMAA